MASEYKKANEKVLEGWEGESGEPGGVRGTTPLTFVSK